MDLRGPEENVVPEQNRDVQEDVEAALDTPASSGFKLDWTAGLNSRESSPQPGVSCEDLHVIKLTLRPSDDTVCVL